jgi:hypothetical protein
MARPHKCPHDRPNVHTVQAVQWSATKNHPHSSRLVNPTDSITPEYPGLTQGTPIANQFDSLGAGGRAFKSPRPDQNRLLIPKELLRLAFHRFRSFFALLCQDCAKTPRSDWLCAGPKPGALSFACRFSFASASRFICSFICEYFLNTFASPWRSNVTHSSATPPALSRVAYVERRSLMRKYGTPVLRNVPCQGGLEGPLMTAGISSLRNRYGPGPEIAS